MPVRIPHRLNPVNQKETQSNVTLETTEYLSKTGSKGLYEESKEMD